jgi:ribosomal protein S18 acetylase RimI-like enzyme
LSGGERDDYVEQLRDARGRAGAAELLVAERAGELVGTVTMCAGTSTFADLAVDDETEIRMLAVAGRAQRSGVARQLIDEVRRRAVELHGSRLVLYVIRDNTAAHRLYTRYGFTRVPDRDWSPTPEVQLLAYQYPLPSRWR